MHTTSIISISQCIPEKDSILFTGLGHTGQYIFRGNRIRNEEENINSLIKSVREEKEHYINEVNIGYVESRNHKFRRVLISK